MVHSLFESDSAQRVNGELFALLLFDAPVNQRKLDVAFCREARNEVEALEDKADFLVAYLRELIVRQV